MKLKHENSDVKLRGAYYTPIDLANALIDKFITKKDKMKILEPSCGDGVFIESLLSKYDEDIFITAVEIEKSETDKLKTNYREYNNIKVINKDFFEFYLKNKNNKYDLIIGNPPYIRYQYLDELQRIEMSSILVSNKMKSNKLINAWVGFTVACTTMVAEGGKLAFVVPAELLQVVYAKELRKFLIENFNEINIVTFSKLVFQDIEQEVVLLVCKKCQSKNGIRIIQTLDIEDFKNKNIEEIKFQEISNDNDKWTKYFTEANEIEYLNEIKSNPLFYPFSKVALINVGITTGHNSYFSIDKKTMEKYDLENYCIPLIGKSCQVHSIYYNKKDLIENFDKGKKAFLFVLPNEENNNFPRKVVKYLDFGKKNGVPDGYKCKIRDFWYSIPSIWVPDAFFARRNSAYPKFILNKCNAVSTDTMHRIKFNKDIDKESVILSYYNSVSLAFTEICGRSYGGGVLEILPSEVGNVYLPNINSMPKDKQKKILLKIDSMVRKGVNIETILDYSDREILVNTLGFSKEYCDNFRRIWKKLQQRRMQRTKNIKN